MAHRLLVVLLLLAIPIIAATPRFAYVANFDDSTVSIFTVNATTGQLRAFGYKFANANPRAVAATPSGRYLYVANQQSNMISGFVITSGTGQLTSIPGASVATASSPRSLAVDESGNFLFVANYGSNTLTTYRVNLTSGALTLINTIATGSHPNAVFAHPGGKFVYVANQQGNSVSGYVLNQTTGQLWPMSGSPFAAGSYPMFLSGDLSGKFLYTANYSSNNISAFVVSAISGALTRVSGSPFVAGHAPYTLAISGRFLYAANSIDGTISGWSINATSGALVPVTGSPYTVGQPNASMAVWVEPSANFLYATNSKTGVIYAFRIDLQTGGLSLVDRIRSRGTGISGTIVGGANPVRYVSRFAYATNDDPNGVSTPSLNYECRGLGMQRYVIDSNTGALTGNALQGPTGYNADCIAMTLADPLSKLLYEYKCLPGSPYTCYLSSWFIGSTGALTFAKPSTFLNSHDPLSAPSLDPAGKFIYTEDALTPGFAINRNTGAFIAIAGVQLALADEYALLASDPIGKYLFVSNHSVGSATSYRVNSAVGTLSQSWQRYSNWEVTVVHQSGRFAYGQYLSGTSWHAASFLIAPSTGALTIAADLASQIPGGSLGGSFVLDPNGRFAYFLEDQKIRIFRINQNNGGLTPISGSPLSTTVKPYGIFPATIDASGRYMYVVDQSYQPNKITVFRVDQATGMLTKITGSPFAISSYGASQITVVDSVQ